MQYSLQQVAEHSSAESCWIIIENRVYDVTNFLPEHPGGSKIILKYAGKDATDAFNAVHLPGIIDAQLLSEKHLGELQVSDATQRKAPPKTRDELRMEREQRNKPSLSKMHNLRDFEDVARKILSYKALGFYSTGSDDEVAMEENRRGFSRLFFLPRVMRPVSLVDPSTTVLGFPSRIPVYVSGAALAKLGHPLGEVNITRACGRTGTIQMVSNNSSCSFSELAQVRVSPDQPLFFQLYKKDDKSSRALVQRIEELGYKAIFLTVDAIVMSNRERDVKSKPADEDMQADVRAVEGGSVADLAAGLREDEAGEEEINYTGAGPNTNLDRDLSWDKTIPWLRSVTKLPIVIKVGEGIQCVEDAVLAAEAGVDGIMISNHGGKLLHAPRNVTTADFSNSGRQMEYSMPCIDVLYRLRKQRPDVFDKVEVHIDGGIRRGTDVLKCLCLGARAVGLGRPILYAQSAYGEAGVIRLFQIMEREIRVGMALLGAATIADLKPELVEQVAFQPAQMQAKL